MLTRLHPFMIVVLFFSAIGFIVRLLANPVSVLFTLAIVGIILFALHTYSKTGRFLPRFTSNKLKRKQNSKTTSVKRSKADKRRAAFQVIKGNKGKEKTKDNNDEPNVYH